jgi:hypothetical protein
MLLQPPPTGVPQPQYQQSQLPYQQPPRQQLVQAQLCQPPQRTGQEKSTTQQNPRLQQAACSTCGNLHAPGRCWMENQGCHKGRFWRKITVRTSARVCVYSADAVLPRGRGKNRVRSDAA